jgi:hypothetical protein
MIHYDLRCAGGHEFDGWFRSSAAFDYQAEEGLLECPACGGTQVSRALMAPRLNRGAAEPAPPPESKTTSGPPAMAVGGMPSVPDQMRAVLQRIRAEVEQKCDYVGPRFAEEARAIHEGTVPERPIYGEATEEQAEALAEDGINVARIPWVPRADG